MNYDAQFSADVQLVDSFLADYMDGLWPYGKLVDAMSYSLLSGGKRIRPVLTLAACRFCGGDPGLALPFACALEMVHTYSLIHDDLPCMDNDDFRRGKATNHKVFGQATAVLAGDALLTEAFTCLARAPGLQASQIADAVRCLSEAAGCGGMVAGQILDMDKSGHVSNKEQVQTIESLKTGKLIVAATTLGCIAARGTEQERLALGCYAENIGLAFQVQDDVLDCVGQAEVFGKPLGSDADNGKVTFVTLCGIDACRTLVRDLTDAALAALPQEERSAFLRQLAETLVDRNR